MFSNFETYDEFLKNKIIKVFIKITQFNFDKQTSRFF